MVNSSATRKVTLENTIQNICAIETQLQTVSNVTLAEEGKKERKKKVLPETNWIHLNIFCVFDLYNYVLCVGTLLRIFQLSGM